MDCADLTIIEARAALRSGKFSCAEYVQALCRRMDAWRGINAFVSQDREVLFAAAKAIDESGQARVADRPLEGIPIALKDNIDTTVLSTSGGTGALRGYTPKKDAEVAKRLFAAGALLAGKTNMHELAFGVTSNNAVTGAVGNPYAPECIPGGSSGGSAAAVSARMVPAALGTDTGASVRLPAALCGVIGFRPTVGRYPVTGVIPISHTRDTPGPIARSVADVILLDGLMAGSEVAPGKTSEIAGLRLGVPRALCFSDMDSELAVVVDNGLSTLQRAGAVLVDVELRDLAKLNTAAGFPIALYELVQDLSRYLADEGYGLDLADVLAGIGSPDVVPILAGQLGPDAVTEVAYQDALRARIGLRASYQECFQACRVDALLFPTAVLPARPIGDDETVELNGKRVPTFATYIRNTDPGSNAGIPGISLPVGLTTGGLPVGLELDGPAGSDERLLAIAAAVERLFPPLPPPAH